jgi:hypothetical protein
MKTVPNQWVQSHKPWSFLLFMAFPRRALVNAAESHCESGGGEIFEGEFQPLLVQTRRTVHIVLMTKNFNHLMSSILSVRSTA